MENEQTSKNLNLSGPASLLVANGEVNLSKGLLDFEARLHLLGNIPLVSKLTQLVDPLSALGNIKIGGSFVEPTWNLQFSPWEGTSRGSFFRMDYQHQEKPKGD